MGADEDALKSWDDFDLDSLVLEEDDEMAELDAELAAFLDEGDAAEANASKDDASGMPERMIKSLEALERDLGLSRSPTGFRTGIRTSTRIRSLADKKNDEGS